MYDTRTWPQSFQWQNDSKGLLHSELVSKVLMISSSSLHNVGNQACFDFTYSFDHFQGIPLKYLRYGIWPKWAVKQVWGLWVLHHSVHSITEVLAKHNIMLEPYKSMDLSVSDSYVFLEL